jgi:membrane protein YqaA with SNARE-associated domain
MVFDDAPVCHIVDIRCLGCEVWWIKIISTAIVFGALCFVGDCVASGFQRMDLWRAVAMMIVVMGGEW